MRPVITAEVSAALDADAPQPVEVLMDRAGYGVARTVAARGFGYGTRCIVLAGPGNNGGDGYVAATYLSRRGVKVTVLAWREPATPACLDAASRAGRAGVEIRSWSHQPEPADVIVDALFGGGFHGALPTEVVPWLGHPAPLVAVDVPSGLSATTGLADGPTFSADVTVTFHAAKTGHYTGVGPNRVGSVEVVDIGLFGGDPSFSVCEESDAPRPDRPWDAHKWSVGSVMVVGGVAGLTGAALLAARAALRFGAGAVSLATLTGTQPIYASSAPEMLTEVVGAGDRYLPDDAPALLESASRFDVMILGPGLGSGHESFVERIVSGWKGRLLLDADALNALAGVAQLTNRPGETIVTPHRGEFERLAGESASFEAARMVASESGVTVALKGWPTFIATGDEVVAVTSGGPELATIGSGDVLAGMIGALWAGGIAGPIAARSGAYWHGRTGATVAETEVVTADRLVGHVGSWNT